MHLKESNVSLGGTCLLNPSDAATQPLATHLHNNNTTTTNTNNSSGDDNTRHTVTSATTPTTPYNNNNNITTTTTTTRSYNIPSSKNPQPLLIINTGSAANGGVLVDFHHGMTASLSSSSLPDLSENGSCSSDRLHHPSISSSGVHRPTRLPVSSSIGSLSSIDNDESDLESYSSLEVDVPRAPDTPDPRAVEDRNLLDFEVLESLWQRTTWKGDSDPLSRPTNDLSPHAHTLCTNNVNELTESGAFVKSFYDKPKLQLESEVTLANDPGDDNGNLRWCVASSGSSPVEQEVCDSPAASPDYASEDENPSDIEQKMAETKVKMNDAILSNGKEELQLHGRKLKHFIKHRELRDSCGAASSVVLANNNNNNNNNSLKQQPGTLKLSDTGADDDNRYHGLPESPIVDAYEKECLDVPEKMVRELETHTKEADGGADDFIPCKKEKMEINELHKKCRSVEGPADGAATPQPPPTPPHCPIRRVDPGANKENSAPSATDIERIRGARVSYCGIEAAALRRDSPQRRRDRVAHRRSVPQASRSPAARERAKLGSPDGGEFDVYTMEAAMPKIDWDTIEAHLQATKEEERRRRNDREEIRRKLAMGLDEDQTSYRPHRKPSLHSRLQSGMNLQICFMNETASDCESQCSDTESTQDVDPEQSSTTSSNSKCSTPHTSKNSSSQSESDIREENFFARQAQLQQEARLALAQAKEMARMQMEIEKQSRKKSPIAEVVRASFNKIGVPFPDSKRRISRQILTDMNVAQLQVIVNDLHTQIESLNEDLVTFLMERDDLHMEQDSMLVDIEDLTKHIGAKESSLRGTGDSKDSSKSLTIFTPTTKTKANSMRLKGIAKK